MTDLLVGGGPLHRNGREAVFKVNCRMHCTFSTRFSKPRWRPYLAPDNRKIHCATRLGALDAPKNSAHKAEEFDGFRAVFSHLFVICLDMMMSELM